MPRRPETRVVHLRRVRDQRRRAHITLWFQFEGGQPKSSRARYSLIRPENMPAFNGDDGWFEIEKVGASRWAFWRAIRQVKPPCLDAEPRRAKLPPGWGSE